MAFELYSQSEPFFIFTFFILTTKMRPECNKSADILRVNFFIDEKLFLFSLELLEILLLVFPSWSLLFYETAEYS